MTYTLDYKNSYNYHYDKIDFTSGEAKFFLSEISGFTKNRSLIVYNSEFRGKLAMLELLSRFFLILMKHRKINASEPAPFGRIEKIDF